MRTRYPTIEPNKTGYLKVSPIHSIYWEECGNPNGKPILFLHGGPGTGIDPTQRCFFDPKVYRIILFDQRGAGKSRPHAEIRENTTWDLVEDIEKLRNYLGISSWVVFGGSWGSFLALVYAETNPSVVKGLILRGIFLARPIELKWFYQFGANLLFPDEYAKFIAMIPETERGDLLQAYHRRLSSTNGDERSNAARAWASWEAALLSFRYDSRLFKALTEDKRAEAIAQIECHFFIHRCFLKTENWILENIAKIRQIPSVIIHGRYDVICPLDAAWALHQAWPESHLEIIPDAGHTASEPGITDALIRATDQFSGL